MQVIERSAASNPHVSGSGSASGGPEGNERLTAVTGAVLLVLFAAEGLTILSVSRLLYWHYLLGFVLVGPICVKCCSTIYRFSRYYARDPEYRRKGPPQPLLRLLGPFVMLSTISVMATGILLGIKGTAAGIGVGPFSLLFLHKISFIGWAALMTIHVLAYIWRLPKLIADDLAPTSRARRAATHVGGRALRWSVTFAGIGGGVALGLACSHLYANWRH